VREAFAEMNRLTELGERAAVAEWCDRVVRLLRDLEATAPDLPTRRQIAYSYFDLTCAYEHLGRQEDAKRTYDQSRDRWALIVNASPADFEALTQLAGCHNHLGLIATAARRWEEAESAFGAALANRKAAHEAHPDNPEQPDNLVYFSGTLCNLGNLHRERGDPGQAVQFYDSAIRLLTELLPPPHEPQEQEMCDLWRDMWTNIYGLPHWARVAQQFLANAQHGKAMVTSGHSVEQEAPPDPAP
jgi:tetratricopeptide (TPR) repeat protein